MDRAFFKNKFALIGLLFVVLIVIVILDPRPSVNTPQKEKDTTPITKTAENDLVRTYVGNLPCDDICKEVETTLILTKNKSGEEGTYRLIEKRIGQWDASLEFDGIWTMGEGLDEDPNAEIIVIDPFDEETIRGFLVLNEKEIEALDEEGYRYKNASSYRLTLK
ncbi:MAG: copper resistance protein NlpE N-terminal domain-containing protein [Candidatus Levybacteria bacterium]|nr:copper resistance protein NlpE N-terminal domain-containing protein [Candidatus Levybacteria bacterium]